MIVNNLKLKAPILSLDFDPSGDFLVTAFANSKEIFIWTNKIGREIMGGAEPIETKFVSKLNQKEWGTGRKKYFKNNENQEIEVVNYDEKEIDDLMGFLSNCTDEVDVEEKEQMIGFFEEDIGRWIPLVHLDEIKEKNKPKEKVESNPVAPFFLEFDNRVKELNDKMEGKIEEEKKGPQKSRIIKKNERNEFLEEVGSSLEKLVTKLTEEEASEEIYQEIFKQMKKLNPSQLDYELRKITFGHIDAVR
jgi:U3 small nucleolar RNA-associated protein 21